MTALSPTPQSSSRRVFSDSDEILILKTLHRLNKKENFSHSSTPLSSSHKLLIFNRINRISGTKFTQNQLSDKIRHLRSKYKKQSRTSASIKTPHNRRLFELSSKIWGNRRFADKDEIEDVEKDENEEDEEEELEKMAEGKQESGSVEGAEANEETKWSKEKQQVVLKKYPCLVSEFFRCYPDNIVWREAFDCLGGEKLREMNDKWLALRTEEAEIMATKFKLFEKQSKLVEESRLKKN